MPSPPLFGSTAKGEPRNPRVATNTQFSNQDYAQDSAVDNLFNLCSVGTGCLQFALPSSAQEQSRANATQSPQLMTPLLRPSNRLASNLSGVPTGSRDVLNPHQMRAKILDVLQEASRIANLDDDHDHDHNQDSTANNQ